MQKDRNQDWVKNDTVFICDGNGYCVFLFSLFLADGVLRWVLTMVSIP